MACWWRGVWGFEAYLLRDVEGSEEHLEIRLGRDVAGDGPHGARGPRGAQLGVSEHLDCVCVWWWLRLKRWTLSGVRVARWDESDGSEGCGRSRGKVVKRGGRRFSFLLQCASQDVGFEGGASQGTYILAMYTRCLGLDSTWMSRSNHVGIHSPGNQKAKGGPMALKSADPLFPRLEHHDVTPRNAPLFRRSLGLSKSVPSYLSLSRRRGPTEVRREWVTDFFNCGGDSLTSHKPPSPPSPDGRPPRQKIPGGVKIRETFCGHVSLHSPPRKNWGPRAQQVADLYVTRLPSRQV